MSVECGVYIVDWDEVEDSLREADAFAVLTGEEVETEDGEYIEEGGLPAEMLSDLSSVVRVQSDFLICYGKFARHWQSKSQPHFEKVFHTFFWSWYSERNRVMELTAPVENIQSIDTALSPATTKQLAEEASKIHWDDCENLYQQHVKEQCLLFYRPLLIL